MRYAKKQTAGAAMSEGNRYRPFKFVQDGGGHFRVVVFATSLTRARRHIKRAAPPAYRPLVYAGEGHPADPKGWLAANAE